MRPAEYKAYSICIRCSNTAKRTRVGGVRASTRRPIAVLAASQIHGVFGIQELLKYSNPTESERQLAAEPIRL